MEAKSDPRDFLSPGVETIGVKACLDFAGAFVGHYGECTLVSIGSGCGAFEFMLQEAYPGTKVIGVDPAPLSFIPTAKVFLEPSCATASELGALASPRLLLFNWCEPNDSTYDAEALALLKPDAFLVVYELCDGASGAAGSRAFFDVLNCDEPTYRLVGQIQGLGSAPVAWGTTQTDVRMQWWERCDTQNPGRYDSPKIEGVEDQGCVLQ